VRQYQDKGASNEVAVKFAAQGIVLGVSTKTKDLVALVKIKLTSNFCQNPGQRLVTHGSHGKAV
jgi:hypothetical protein